MPHKSINVQEIVREVRSGVPDTELMEKYELSAIGLVTLFKKLVKMGEVEESEINRRAMAGPSAQTVVLEEFPELSLPRSRINPMEAVKAIKTGKSDEELMAQYDLSVEGLESLMSKLVQVGALHPGELHKRKISSKSAQSVVVDQSPEVTGLKPRIDVPTAVAEIRTGADEDAILEKYAISSRGLESLVNMLFRTGKIDQHEYDRLRAGTSPTEPPDPDETDEERSSTTARLRIDPETAVEEIQCGVSNAEILRKYDISPRAFESLVEMLVRTGKIDQNVVAQRENLSAPKVPTATDSVPSPRRLSPKPKIKPLEAVTAIRSGTTDETLLDKYDVSKESLDGLFNMLVNMGVIARSELDRRKQAPKSPLAVSGRTDVTSRSKPVIDAMEAVKVIRSNKSDEELMDQYDITAKGLQSLFKKLVSAGAISQSELDQRALYSKRSPSIILEDHPETETQRPVVNAKEAVADILSGMSDQGLMSKYGLSAKGLEGLFKKLVRAGSIEQDEIARRTLLAASSVTFVLEQASETDEAETQPPVPASDDMSEEQPESFSTFNLDDIISRDEKSMVLDGEDLDSAQVPSSSFEFGQEDAMSLEHGPGDTSEGMLEKPRGFDPFELDAESFEEEDDDFIFTDDVTDSGHSFDPGREEAHDGPAGAEGDDMVKVSFDEGEPADPAEFNPFGLSTATVEDKPAPDQTGDKPDSAAGFGEPFDLEREEVGVKSGGSPEPEENTDDAEFVFGFEFEMVTPERKADDLDTRTDDPEDA
ncbi:hypothetical protein ACFL2Q_05465 [Thermodesulfobacteriota bacterium]